MRAAKALQSLCICADTPESVLFANAISTKIACAQMSDIKTGINNNKERTIRDSEQRQYERPD